MLQHGDLILVKVDHIPEDATPAEVPNVVLEGELTGHAHRLLGQAALVMLLKDQRFVRVEAPTKLLHEEHKEQTIPPGDYRVDRVQEYDPFAELIKKVAD